MSASKNVFGTFEIMILVPEKVLFTESNCILRWCSSKDAHNLLSFCRKHFQKYLYALFFLFLHIYYSKKIMTGYCVGDCRNIN